MVCVGVDSNTFTKMELTILRLLGIAYNLQIPFTKIKSEPKGKCLIFLIQFPLNVHRGIRQP